MLAVLDRYTKCSKGILNRDLLSQVRNAAFTVLAVSVIAVGIDTNRVFSPAYAQTVISKPVMSDTSPLFDNVSGTFPPAYYGWISDLGNAKTTMQRLNPFASATSDTPPAKSEAEGFLSLIVERAHLAMDVITGNFDALADTLEAGVKASQKVVVGKSVDKECSHAEHGENVEKEAKSGKEPEVSDKDKAKKRRRIGFFAF